MTYNPDFYYYVKLTLKSKTDATDTKTLYIGNRSAYGETSLQIWNGLLRIGGLDSGTSGNLPRIGNGQIVIDNTRGLFNNDMRFVDYLDKYTLIYQDVEIYQNKVSLDAAISGTATKFWVDKVLRVDATDDRVTLYLRTDLIPDREVCAIVYTDTYANAPSASIGKAVPLILGENQQVKPVMIKDDGNSSEIAYATTYGSHFVNVGIQKYYARSYKNEYVEIENATHTTEIIGTDATPSGTSYPLPVATGGWAAKLVPDPTPVITSGELPDASSYIITTWGLAVYKPTGAPTDEVLTIGIYEKDSNREMPGKAIATSTLESSVLATGWSSATGHFNTPVILDPGVNYYFGFHTNHQDNSTTATNRLEYKLSAGIPGVWYQMDTGSNTASGEWNSNYTGSGVQLWLYAAEMTDTTSPAGAYIADNGRGVSYFSLDAQAPTQPDLRKVDWIIEANGLKDTSGGGVTGTANKLLDEPHHALDALMYTWSGTAWAAGPFNSTVYSATHTQMATGGVTVGFRKLGGSTRGKISLRQLCSEICAETLCYLTRVDGENGTALYAYGSAITSTGYITDRDIDENGIQYSVDNRSSIANVARASYNRKLTETDFSDTISQGGELSYSSFKEFRYDDAGTGQGYSEECEALYGEVETARRIYNWVSHATSISNILELILGQADLPTELATLRVPYYKYKDLKQWDVVDIKTSMLPQVTGTAPQQQPKTYVGTTTTEQDGNDLEIKAKSYRAQILSISNDFSTKVPMRQFILKLIVSTSDRT